MTTQGKVVTFPTTAWLTGAGSTYLDLDDLLNGDANGDIGFSVHTGMEEYGWTRLGDASVTVNLPTREALLENKVLSLKAEREKLVAETHVALEKLDNQIKSLLSLPAPPIVIDVLNT